MGQRLRCCVGCSRGSTLRSRVCCQRQHETAWEDGRWRQRPIFEWLKPLKAEAQERCRGETDPTGERGDLGGLELPVARLAEDVETSSGSR